LIIALSGSLLYQMVFGQNLEIPDAEKSEFFFIELHFFHFSNLKSCLNSFKQNNKLQTFSSEFQQIFRLLVSTGLLRTFFIIISKQIISSEQFICVYVRIKLIFSFSLSIICFTARSDMQQFLNESGSELIKILISFLINPNYFG
jgi:hypothetical protein